MVSPYAQAFQIAATDWGGLSPEYDFVGLDNFRRLLGDGYFWNALRHNALLLSSCPVVTILLGLFFASMISVAGPARTGSACTGCAARAVYRIVYFFPQVAVGGDHRRAVEGDVRAEQRAHQRALRAGRAGRAGPALAG